MPVIAKKNGITTTTERHDDHTHIRTPDGAGGEWCGTVWDDGVREMHHHPAEHEPVHYGRPTHRYVMRHGQLFCLLHEGMCEAPGETTH
jgi:hypothetical protein